MDQPNPPAGSPAPGGQYEFTTAENDVFAGLAGKMRFVGIVLSIVGVLYLVIGALLLVGAFSGQSVPTKSATGTTVSVMRLGPEHCVGYLVGGILYLAMGSWTTKGAASLRRIVDTQGSDIRHLMEAMTNLRKLYTLQFWMIVLALIIMVVATIFIVVALASR